MATASNGTGPLRTRLEFALNVPQELQIESKGVEQANASGAQQFRYFLAGHYIMWVPPEVHNAIAAAGPPEDESGVFVITKNKHGRAAATWHVHHVAPEDIEREAIQQEHTNGHPATPTMPPPLAVNAAPGLPMHCIAPSCIGKTLAVTTDAKGRPWCATHAACLATVPEEWLPAPRPVDTARVLAKERATANTEAAALIANMNATDAARLAPVPATPAQQWPAFLAMQTNRLIDAFAECLRHASQTHGLAIKPEDVRTLLTTAYIGLQKQGGVK